MRCGYINGPSVVPVARCRACEIACCISEQPVVAAAAGVAPVASIVPVVPLINSTYRR